MSAAKMFYIDDRFRCSFAVDHFGKSDGGVVVVVIVIVIGGDGNWKCRARDGGRRGLFVVDQLVEFVGQLVADRDAQLAHSVSAAVHVARTQA